MSEEHAVNVRLVAYTGIGHATTATKIGVEKLHDPYVYVVRSNLQYVRKEIFGKEAKRYRRKHSNMIQN